MELTYEEIVEAYKQKLANAQQEIILLELQVKKLQEQKELPKEE
jgi:hypothetical protein